MMLIETLKGISGKAWAFWIINPMQTNSIINPSWRYPIIVKGKLGFIDYNGNEITLGITNGRKVNNRNQSTLESI